ncbi:MAG: DUF7453 family protein [Candidatus Angelobacter sp.]
MKSRRVAILILLASIFAAQTTFAQSQFKFKEVLKTGDAAPVPPQLGSVLESNFDDQGRVALIADGGVILKSGDQIIPIAGPGDPAPGGGTFLSFTTPSLGPQGQLLFTSIVGFSGSVASKAFLYSNGSISQLLPNGMVADTGELVFPASATFARNGDMLITDSTPQVFATYLLSNNTLTRVMGPGDVSPENGDVIAVILGATVNSSRQVVITAETFGASQAMFLWSAGTVTEIIDTSAFMADGVRLSFFENPSINDFGQVVFSAISDSSADSGIYTYFNGQLSLLIPEFTALPDGSKLETALTTSVNNAGRIAFSALTTAATNNNGVFLFANGQITSVAITGQAAPDGGIFRQGVEAGGAINSSGQVLFTGAGSQHGIALYLFSANQLSRVIGQGDPIARQPAFVFPTTTAIAAGDVLLISDTTFPGGASAYTATARGNPRGRTRLVVHEGESIGADGVIDFLLGSSMNESGGVIAGVGTSNALAAVLSDDKTSLQVVADGAAGSAVKPTDNTQAINNLGEIAFTGFAPATQTAGVFLNSGGQTRLLLDAATPLPGGGAISGNIPNLSLNSLDQIAFMAQPSSGPVGIFVAANGAITPLAIDGTPAPGGGNFRLFFGPSFDLLRGGPVIDDHGDVAFGSRLTSVPVGGILGFGGIFLYKDGVVSRIAGPNDPSPDGGVFLFADSPSINSSGDVAFFGETSAFSFGAFVYSKGKITQVAIAGDFVNGIRLSFVDLPVINDNGHVGFTASVFDGNDHIDANHQFLPSLFLHNLIFLAAPTGDKSAETSDWAESAPGAPPAPERMKAIRAQNDKALARRAHKASVQNMKTKP